MSLPYFIKLSPIVWPAQDFCFRGEIYIKKKVRVVSLARDMPTGLPLHPHQMLSNYLKQYGSYGVHKTSDSGEILHNDGSESCLSCTRHAYWSSSSILPNIVKICLRISKLWRAQGCVYDFCNRKDNYITKKAVFLACDMPTGPPLHPYQNILKLSQTLSELLPAQDFGFRGDNYITKKVRVVSCARHVYWSSSSLYIIKICLRVSK